MTTNGQGPEYQLDPTIPIDIEHTLFQLLGTFQGVKDGLPELVKNAKDQYARLRIVDRGERQIVVVADSKGGSIAVLDFGGATLADFDRWKTWSDPNASRAIDGGEIEGGHGNGGKAFMTRGSLTDSFFESCTAGRRTKMGYRNNDRAARFRPGYAKEGGAPVKDLAEAEPKKRLEKSLRGLACSYTTLPPEARAQFEKRKSFTLVEVNGVRDWEHRRPRTLQQTLRALPQSLKEHAQTAMTIDSCSVWVLVDGKLITEAPLSPEYPLPLAGFENLPPIPIPDELPDPETGEAVSTGAGGADPKYLQLRTSARHLRTPDLKALNVIRVRNSRNIVANLSLADLVPLNESGFILGDLRLPSIGPDHVAGADRKGLADTALTRAVQQWLESQVELLAQRIQRAITKDHKPQDRNRANDSLQRIRDLMRKFLEPEDAEGTDEGVGGQRGDGDRGHKREVPEHRTGSAVHVIELEPGRKALSLASGCQIPLIAHCYEQASDGQLLPVSRVELELVTPEIRIVTLSPTRMLKGDTAGRTQVAVRDKASGVQSNPIDVEVVDCTGVDVAAPGTELLQGQRVLLKTYFATGVGHRDDLLIEGSIDEPDMGRISRGGMFTAGLQQGVATVRVRFGPKLSDWHTLPIRIGADTVPPRGRGGEGSDIPYILVCGTTAPGHEDIPPEQRTHRGGEHHPTIIEEPPFDEIVWINPDSKEASRVRQGRGGRRGATKIGAKSFTQFLALKCFEILKRLKVRQELRGTSINELQFRQLLAQAEMDCADFVDEAFELADQLNETESEDSPA